MNTQDIVQKLWNLCHVLRDDGITYHEYVTELTFLLFLKMMKETGAEDQIPRGYRWDDVEKKDGVELLEFYKKLLIDLGSKGSGRVQAIFANASTSFRQPRHLRTVVENIDALDWYSAKSEGLGDLYEGLLEKNAEETKSGAGQYFTPRPLIESMVALIKPQPGERVQDPAVGTGGFLINADRYVRSLTDGYHDLSVAKQNFQRREAFYGVELVPDVQRLALMNAMLHDIEGDIVLGDTLGPTGAQLPKADVILTNPPFGTKKGGGGPTRDDITYPTSNKQLVFLQHIYRGLRPGGRAAVVLPDNVLFEEGTGQKVRADLMAKCDLHTILRLPTGIFYAQGVKTNVLFFTRGETRKQLADFSSGHRKPSVTDEKSKGPPLSDVWEVSIIPPSGKERLGYPTQKPEKLLERVVLASSNEGDVVLDPFCGCGTAVAVAHRLGRQWIGVDITHLAINLIKRRLHDSFGFDARVVGEPASLPDAEALARDNPYQFQWWALGVVGARPVVETKGADAGIDGRLYFHDDPGPRARTKQILFSVKSGHVGVADVRELLWVVEREKAEMGALITMQPPTQPMRAEAAGAGSYRSAALGVDCPKLQILTVEDIFNEKSLILPAGGQTNMSYKHAPPASADATQQELSLGPPLAKGKDRPEGTRSRRKDRAG